MFGQAVPVVWFRPTLGKEGNQRQQPDSIQKVKLPIESGKTVIKIAIMRIAKEPLTNACAATAGGDLLLYQHMHQRHNVPLVVSLVYVLVPENVSSSCSSTGICQIG